MRIALVQHELGTGAADVVRYQSHGLANALVDAGHEVSVFSPGEKPTDAAYDHVHLPACGPFKAARWAVDVRRQCFDGFDVFHVVGDNAQLIGRRRPVSLRSTMRVCVSDEIGGQPSHSLTARTAVLLGEWLDAVALGTPVPISELSRICLLQHQEHVPCGAGARSTVRSPRREPAPTILFAGSLVGSKRGRFLADVFQHQVLPEFPDARLWTLSDDQTTAEGVETLGNLDDENEAERFERAWIYCDPSVTEPYGVNYLRALAAGTPIVTSANPAAQELLGGRYGLVAGDDGFGAAINGLLGDETGRSAMEAEAHERAQRYSWDRIAAQYLAIYERKPTGRNRRAAFLPLMPVFEAAKYLVRLADDAAGQPGRDARWRIWLSGQKRVVSWAARQKCVQVPVDRIYHGGVSGLTALEYAAVTGDESWPRTRVADGPLAATYRRYARGEVLPPLPASLADDPNLRQALAVRRYHGFPEDDSERAMIEKTVANQHERFDAGLDRIDKRGHRPILRRIAGTDCYEVVDGHHRVAAMIARGQSEIWADITWSIVPCPAGFDPDATLETPND